MESTKHMFYIKYHPSMDIISLFFIYLYKHFHCIHKQATYLYINNIYTKLNVKITLSDTYILVPWPFTYILVPYSNKLITLFPLLLLLLCLLSLRWQSSWLLSSCTILSLVPCSSDHVLVLFVVVNISLSLLFSFRHISWWIVNNPWSCPCTNCPFKINRWKSQKLWFGLWVSFSTIFQWYLD